MELNQWGLTMNRVVAIAIAVGCLLAASCSQAQAAFVVGAFDSTRAGDGNLFNGTYSEDAIAALSESFPGTTYTAAPELTPAFLAGVDILILAPAKGPSTAISPLSVAEQSALLDFVTAGGRALLFGERNFSLITQSYMGPLGVSFANNDAAGVFLVDPSPPVHAVFNGPFGEVAQAIFYSAGIFTDLGPNAIEIAFNTTNAAPVMAAIESHALAPNSGRVVLISDSTPFFDTADGGLFDVQEHRDLFLNSIHYLATPEPSSLALLCIAGGFAGLSLGVRRARQLGTRGWSSSIQARGTGSATATPVRDQ